MIFYHGSKNIINKPIAHGSNKYNDYGPAFYLTMDMNASKSWACKNDEIGIVNKYYIDKKAYQSLKILDLTDKSTFSVLNWIAILMHFRKLDSSFSRNNKYMLEWLEQYYIDINNYDVVIGYRADDSYFKFPIRFISNDLAIEDLEYIFKLGNLGIQYAFISEKAINYLVFKEAINCEYEYVGHYYNNVIMATNEFNELIDRPRDPNKHYILDLVRGNR